MWTVYDLGMELGDILKERGNRYGEFKDNAEIAQALKNCVRLYPGWDKLADDQKECFDMIFAKMSRVLTGDPDYADNFSDIAGYAQLIVNRLLQQ